jgi:hypothetical protein
MGGEYRLHEQRHSRKQKKKSGLAGKKRFSVDCVLSFAINVIIILAQTTCLTKFHSIFKHSNISQRFQTYWKSM